MQAAIDIQGLTHSHPGAASPLFQGLTFRVASGELLGLTGASGSGKTTLLNVIAALVRPDAGTIRIVDSNLASMSPSDAARWRGQNIGYAYQDSRLLPQLDVVTNVAWPLLFGETSRESALRQAHALLKRLNLTSLADHRPQTLSGGEQRRIALARALIAHPPLLLVDEPTANLDPDSADGILTLLDQMREEFPTTMLMVSHSPEALARCDRTAHLSQGVIEEATPCA